METDQKTQALYFGVDVGKDDLMLSDGSQKTSEKLIKLPTRAIKNDLLSINEWIETLPQNAHVVFESTGNYSLSLSYCLEIADIFFTVITPSQSKGFAKSLNITNQTDAIDACLLAQYGASHHPQRTIIESDTLHHLKQKRKHLSSLMAQKQVVTNQIHALSFDSRASKSVIESLELLHNTFLIQIEQFNKELFTLDDEKYKELFKLMTSVVGIGEVSANAMIISTNGFENFENAKQVLKFFGIVPQLKDSGITVRKKYGLAKSGVSYVRSILYNAAKSAKMHNLACKELYNRLRKAGKAHKVAMVAVMRKLVNQVYAVTTKKIAFVNNYEFTK
jgi:transposase